MSLWVMVAIIIGAIVLLGAARCIYELHTLAVTKYELTTPKITENKRILFISDLHCRSYGEHNEKLIKIIISESPDLILVGGDVLVSNNPKKDEIALDFLKQLPKVAPVYFANGNHEKAVEALSMFKDRNEEFQKFLRENGIKNLANASDSLGEITITGLDVDYRFYKKFHPERLTREELNQYLAKCTQSSYNILMSHDPGNFRVIASPARDYGRHKCHGGADSGMSCGNGQNGKIQEGNGQNHIGFDLVLSGHYHGGSIRLPKIGGVISPQFRIFPYYSKGIFKNGNTTMIVTGGAGSHTVNLRIFNKPEVVVIDIRSEN